MIGEREREREIGRISHETISPPKPKPPLNNTN